MWLARNKSCFYEKQFLEEDIVCKDQTLEDDPHFLVESCYKVNVDVAGAVTNIMWGIGGVT